jgi:hypothetical protein
MEKQIFVDVIKDTDVKIQRLSYIIQVGPI